MPSPPRFLRRRACPAVRVRPRRPRRRPRLRVAPALRCACRWHVRPTKGRQVASEGSYPLTGCARPVARRCGHDPATLGPRRPQPVRRHQGPVGRRTSGVIPATRLRSSTCSSPKLLVDKTLRLDDTLIHGPRHAALEEATARCRKSTCRPGGRRPAHDKTTQYCVVTTLRHDVAEVLQRWLARTVTRRAASPACSFGVTALHRRIVVAVCRPVAERRNRHADPSVPRQGA